VNHWCLPLADRGSSWPISTICANCFQLVNKKKRLKTCKTLEPLSLNGCICLACCGCNWSFFLLIYYCCSPLTKRFSFSFDFGTAWAFLVVWMNLGKAVNPQPKLQTAGPPTPHAWFSESFVTTFDFFRVTPNENRV